MPALRGSLTYARFFVDAPDGGLAEGFRERFMRAIKLRAMKPLEADEDVAERSGWCQIGEPFELALSHQLVFYDNYINLGFRTDRWVIPGPLLRARMREAEAVYLAKKGRERLSKRERSELKEVVSRKLRKQFVPSSRAIDLSWSLDEKLVRFFSLSARPTASMLELFEKTFGLKLVPEAPYTLAARAGLSKAAEKTWDSLEVTQLEAPREV
jgi:DNA recombination-dependent growth factor C